VNAALTRIYEWSGPRYIPMVIASMWAWASMQLTIALWLEVRYLDASTGDFLTLTAIGLPIIFVALVIGLAASWEALAPPYQWLKEGRPSERADEVWRRSFSAGFVAVNRTAIAAAIAIVPYHLFASPEILDVGVEVAMALILFGEIAVATAWVVGQFLIDLILRPVVRDLTSQLSDAPEDPPSGWRLRSKALITVPVAAFYGAFAAGAFVLDQATPEAQLYTAIAAAAVVTLLFAGPVAVIATGSILDPVNDLIAATRRIAKGELSAPVPILTDDEFGDLGRSFNRMQEGLRERESLREDLRASRARIVTTADAERRRLERDLHDGAQQNLVLLNLKLGLLERTVEGPAAKAAVQELKQELQRALEELRDLAHGIYPPLLVNEGLPGALAEASERAAIPASFNADGAGRYPPELEAAVYFCCLEALQNASKHAGEAARATVTLNERDGELSFEVRDDGRGYDAERVASSAGLQNMSDRIGALGGELRVESRPGAGTTVSGRIPLAGGPAGAL
jgi:signal transduction histidine kinase